MIWSNRRVRRDTTSVSVEMNGEEYAHLRPGFWGSQYLTARGTDQNVEPFQTIYVRHPIHRHKVAMTVTEVRRGYGLVGWDAEERSRFIATRRYTYAQT